MIFNFFVYFLILLPAKLMAYVASVVVGFAVLLAAFATWSRVVQILDRKPNGRPASAVKFILAAIISFYVLLVMGLAAYYLFHSDRLF